LNYADNFYYVHISQGTTFLWNVRNCLLSSTA